MNTNTIIQIIVLIVSLVGVYWKLVIEINKLKDANASLKELLDNYVKHTPVCNKKFDDISIDIETLKTQEKMKDQYQTQIVEKILQPILREMNEKIAKYVDIKTDIISKEIEAMKTENSIFKSEFKTSLREIKEENSKQIDRIIIALEKR